MKQGFFRLLRHDQSEFKPMKRWFRSFGFALSGKFTDSADGNQGSSDPESNEVIGPPGEAVVRGTSPYRDAALVDPYEGQLEPELVRDVFTADNTPVEYSTPPESQPQFADGLSDGEEAATEKGSSPEAAAEVFLEEPETEANSTRQPRNRPRFGPHSEAPPTTKVKTMVESIADRTLGVEQGLDLLPDGLEGVFQRNVRVNMALKTLLLNLEPVDLKELTEELKYFAETIGAINRPE